MTQGAVGLSPISAPPLRILEGTKPAAARGYRPDIDGLRAIAILTVVGSHVRLPWWSGGYVGVDVFCNLRVLDHSLLVTEAVQYRRIHL